MDLKLEACARAAHEANRAYSIAIGDPFQPMWEAAPIEMKETVRAGVEGVLMGHNEEASHDAWVERMLAEGWQYGKQKSWQNKIHPNLVPFKDLPREQSEKDRLFVGAVRIMAAALGMKVIFPAEPARNGRPAVPRREIDWSTGETTDLGEGE